MLELNLRVAKTSQNVIHEFDIIARMELSFLSDNGLMCIKAVLVNCIMMPECHNWIVSATAFLCIVNLWHCQCLRNYQVPCVRSVCVHMMTTRQELHFQVIKAQKSFATFHSKEAWESCGKAAICGTSCLGHAWLTRTLSLRALTSVVSMW